ncbi:MAG TPA: aconitate hydratase, partial [Bacteroidales bacterium]|nr:aconitate hydratase [Bacteroidales bacterium]
VLALTFRYPDDYGKIKEDDRIDITGITGMTPGSTLRLLLRHSDGTSDEIPLAHSYSEKQIEWFRAGSALNVIRKQNIS